MSDDSQWQAESAATVEEARGIWRRIRSGDTFIFLFFLLLLDFTVSVAVGHNTVGRVLVGLFSGATPTLALLAAQAPRRWVLGSIGVLVLAVVGSVLEAALTGSEGSGVPAILLSVVLFFCIPITLLRLLEHETVTGETVAGSLCVYLLLGMAFADLYVAMDLLGSPILEGVAPTVGTVDRADCFYFSFVAMLTIGFGDVVPAGRAGQVLVVLQTITGQVVLLTLVARMVNVAQVKRRSLRRPVKGERQAED